MSHVKNVTLRRIQKILWKGTDVKSAEKGRTRKEVTFPSLQNMHCLQVGLKDKNEILRNVEWTDDVIKAENDVREIRQNNTQSWPGHGNNPFWEGQLNQC